MKFKKNKKHHLFFSWNYYILHVRDLFKFKLKLKVQIARGCISDNSFTLQQISNQTLKIRNFYKCKTNACRMKFLTITTILRFI